MGVEGFYRDIDILIVLLIVIASLSNLYIGQSRLLAITLAFIRLRRTWLAALNILVVK